MSGSMKCPKGEIVWISYFDSGRVLRFFLTSKPARDMFYLYEVAEDLTYVKLGKAKSPVDLEAKYNVMERIGIGV